MNSRWMYTLGLVVGLALASWASAEPQVLTSRLHHLRLGQQPEWAEFPKQSEGSSLTIPFQTHANVAEVTLRLRQQDVRETWKIRINGKDVAKLIADENEMTICLPVPPGFLRQGENVLSIEQVGKIVDDIRVGDIIFDPRPLAKHLADATVEIDVREKGQPVPCRITILDAKGSLATIRASSESPLAVRPGVIYTGDGRARITMPAGAYTIIAGRGFEYGIASVRIDAKLGDVIRKSLVLHREVPTEGWISCDPHIHTLTFSGHGDATLDERMLTLAGEGIELPIATDHNRQIDFHAAATKMKVRRFFTPIVGNEVTTPVGHFNLFPLLAEVPPPEFKHKDWKSAFAAISQTDTKAIILNHARDIHTGFRPFGPDRHLALTGEDLEGWRLKANAMEVVNSGAQQSDVMQLVHDWFGMLNGGHILTPVGSSDSHDVSRYIVGQGRTYIRGNNRKPGDLDISRSLENLVGGRVSVSCGLLTEITVNGRYGPGDLMPKSPQVEVAVRVLGPSWVKADKVELYMNGQRIQEARFDAKPKAGVHWQGTWKLKTLNHDVHLVAVASGSGVRELYWPLARPYQPTSPIDNRRVIGITGAVWVDADGDGERSSAFEYAKRLIKGPEDIAALAPYDEAIATQAAGILRRAGIMPHDEKIVRLIRLAGPQVERGFETYWEAWRTSEIARNRPR